MISSRPSIEIVCRVIETKMVNNRLSTLHAHRCCVCGAEIWQADSSGYIDNLDFEVRPGEWLVTCGYISCVEQLHTNPMAYE